MDKLRAAWAWVRNNAVALVLGSLAVIGIVLGHKEYQRRVGKLQDEKKMLEARSRIAELEGKREILEKQEGLELKHIRGIDAEIMTNKRIAVEAHAESEGLDNAEILDEFARLGY